MSAIQRILPVVFIASLCLLSSASAKEDLMEGVQYERITPAQPTTAPKGKVEIAEWFWYGCPHCFRFEPFVDKWLENKSDDIVFIRVPAAINPKWEIHARVFYAAEALGVGDKIHKPLFYAIHAEKRKLDSKESLLDFIEGLGIDRKKFGDAMNSFAINSKIQRSQQLAKIYKLQGVPAVIIDGKYLTGGAQAGSFNAMVDVMQQLADRELAAKADVAAKAAMPTKTE